LSVLESDTRQYRCHDHPNLGWNVSAFAIVAAIKGLFSRPAIEPRRLVDDLIKAFENLNLPRRRFFGAATMGIAAKLKIHYGPSFRERPNSGGLTRSPRPRE
jgi:hypothetical protein